MLHPGADCGELCRGIPAEAIFPEARGSGVPQTEAAYHLQDGYVPGRVAFGKFLTGVMCIGCGHSMGREGPSVQIAAGMASTDREMVPAVAGEGAEPGAGGCSRGAGGGVQHSGSGGAVCARGNYRRHECAADRVGGSGVGVGGDCGAIGAGQQPCLSRSAIPAGELGGADRVSAAWRCRRGRVAGLLQGTAARARALSENAGADDACSSPRREDCSSA